jgi:hypothetical protein
MIKTVFILVSLTLTCAVAGFAQTSSTLTGLVSDQQGGALPGAGVTARHVETGLTRHATTGLNGRYTIALLPVGVYDVTAELSGFAPAVRQGVRLTVNETALLNLTLAVQGVDQRVTVVGQLGTVNTRSSELSYLVSEETIRELPLNGRNYTDLALLQPGVVAYPHRDGGSVVAHGLGMSINGQDPRSNVYLLDGTLLNDFTNGPAGSAAGTSLGTETIREFRVEANAYSAEFGRNSGGQINAVTKSGTNQLHGSAYHFHRNDALDARNYFDPDRKPEFRRNQFGATIGGPLQRDRLFLFAGYEALRERLGRTISTVVPDTNARQGLLPNPSGSIGDVRIIGVDPAVRPYLEAYPTPNGRILGSGLAVHTFPFDQRLTQDFAQGRIDYTFSSRHQTFARYTYDGAEQRLPTEFPQFPRSFLSRNQFFTLEHRFVASDRTLHTFRGGFSRTRVGQAVEANTASPLAPFVPTRGLVGNIDIAGIPRFGPQTSVTVRLVQNVFAAEHGMAHTRGRHLLKAGGLVERYQDNMVNPTFSLGIYTFNSLEDFLRNRPVRFLGLAPQGALDRYWRFTLLGAYVQDDIQLTPRVTLNAGVRVEHATLPVDIYGRDATLINLTDTQPTVGRNSENPNVANLSPRVGVAWNVTGDGRTSLRAGYGRFYNTNSHQNLIVTVTNPPATPRVVIANPTFPNPPFERGLGNTIRPVQWDLDAPEVHVWNLNAQREVWGRIVAMVGYAGSRGIHLLRSGDVNVPTPTVTADGRLFFPLPAARPNPAFTTVERKSSDGNSWYNAGLLELRRQWRGGFAFQSSYTFSRNIDTTQASTFFSDATNGTTSAFPEFPGVNYNKGLADYHAKHNLVVNFTWEIPFGRNLTGAAKHALHGWRLSGIGHARSGGPLTVFIAANRSRSRWSPSLGPGIGFDRPDLAPGRTLESAVLGRPEQYFDPTAFGLQPAGVVGNLGRGAFIGPNLRIFDLAAVKSVPWTRVDGRLEIRLEAFNLFNRTNFGPPALTAFAGSADNEAPLSSFGRIRTTVTSSRQIQVGLRMVF